MCPERLSPAEIGGSASRRLAAELAALFHASLSLQNAAGEDQALRLVLSSLTAGNGAVFDHAAVLLADGRDLVLRARRRRNPEEPASLRRPQPVAGLAGGVRQSPDSNGAEANHPSGAEDSLRISLENSAHALVRIMRARRAVFASHGLFEPLRIPVTPDLIEWFGTDLLAAAPLFFAGEDLGVLVAGGGEAFAPPDDSDLKLLEVLALAASSAVWNARLRRRLQEQIRAAAETNAGLLESQRELVKVERLSAMGRVATLLAYRIRAPLTSIGGFTRRLLSTMSPEDPRKAEMEIVVSDVARMERLAEEALVYSRISEPEFSPTDVNALIRSVLGAMEEEIRAGSIRVELQLKPDLPAARIDETQVRQALMNLAANAVEAMPGGGTLGIKSGSDADFLEIEVADTGTGIPRRNWDKLFKPFFTTKTTGTGLGLAAVAQVVENHSGSLRFRSEPGAGTTFNMRLAIQPRGAVAHPEGRKALPPGEKSA